MSRVWLTARAVRYITWRLLRARASQEFQDKALWAPKAILNVARMGKFSSDRSIQEYAREIWGLDLSRCTPSEQARIRG